MTSKCKYCGTYCNFSETKELIPQTKVYEVMKRDTETDVIEKIECEFCGTINLRWLDEKINCEYCGELV